VAAVLSRRQRKTEEPLSGHPHQFGLKRSHFLEVLDWELEGEARLNVVCVALSMPYLSTAERSGCITVGHRFSYLFQTSVKERPSLTLSS
jgi:hypothetical protein